MPDTVLFISAQSDALRRGLGPMAWAALEHLALAAHQDRGMWVAPVGVRDVAAGVGITKDSAARAVAALGAAGLVRLTRVETTDGKRRSGYELHLPQSIRLSGSPVPRRQPLGVRVGNPQPKCADETDTNDRLQPGDASQVRRERVTFHDNGTTDSPDESPHTPTFPPPVAPFDSRQAQHAAVTTDAEGGAGPNANGHGQQPATEAPLARGSHLRTRPQAVTLGFRSVLAGAMRLGAWASGPAGRITFSLLVRAEVKIPGTTAGGWRICVSPPARPCRTSSESGTSEMSGVW